MNTVNGQEKSSRYSSRHGVLRSSGAALSFGLQEQVQPVLDWPVREFSLSAARASPYYARARDLGMSDFIGQSAGVVWLGAPLAEQKAAIEPSVFRGRIVGPVRLFRKIVERWGIADHEAAILLGYDDPNFARDVLGGLVGLRNRDVRDRIKYLFGIYERLFHLFRDESAEIEWLRRANDDLSGKAPLNYILEGAMLNLIIVKQYLDRVTGL
jgi:hypothetical protein